MVDAWARATPGRPHARLPVPRRHAAQGAAVGRARRGHGYGVEIVDDRVPALEPGFSVRLGGGQVLATRRLVVATGVGDHDDGVAIVDRTGRTTVAGVWAAGNVVDPRTQVITVAGAGSAATIAVNADLVQDDRGAGRDRGLADLGGQGAGVTRQHVADPFPKMQDRDDRCMRPIQNALQCRQSVLHGKRSQPYRQTILDTGPARNLAGGRRVGIDR